MNDSTETLKSDLTSPKEIRLGTRGSQLALVQSNWVKTQLEHLGHQVRLVEIKTEGDLKTGPLAQIGGQGLFTKRLQIALLQQEVDLAVHSLKDLPTEDHPQLIIGAVPERENPADALITRSDGAWDTLPEGAMVGTGSVRRVAQLLHLRPDLRMQDIRGNVDTRLRKLEKGNFDAIVLACAGLNRMGLGNRISHAFATDQVLPAVGQGCLGLEIRADDSATMSAISSLNDPASFGRAIAERAMLRALYAGCLAPVGAKTAVDQQQLSMTGVVLSPDGKIRLVASDSGPLENAIEIGQAVAQRLLDAGAKELLRTPEKNS